MEMGDNRGVFDWRPVELEPEYCFDAVSMNALGRAEDDSLYGISGIELKKKVRQHLLALGWKVECKRDVIQRYRFRSPEGKWYFSLSKVCNYLMDMDRTSNIGVISDNLDSCQENNNAGKSSYDVQEVEDKMFMMRGRKRKLCIAGSSDDLDSRQETNNIVDVEKSTYDDVQEVEDRMSRSGRKRKLCFAGFGVVDEEVREDKIVQGDCTADSVRRYQEFMESKWRTGKQKLSNNELRLLREDVKEHLLQMGWMIWMKQKKAKAELCYTSPYGKHCCSLAIACKECLRIRAANPKECMDSSNKSNVTSDSWYEKRNFKIPAKSKEFTARRARISKKRKASRNSSSDTESCTSDESYSCRSSYKRRKKCLSSAGQCVESRKTSSRVLRSSATSKCVLTSTNEHSVKTVLSWLIGKKTVKLGQKVNYVSENDGICKKEGRVFNEGIMCMCCGEIFSIAKFEAHAGERTRCPSANIFFNDGISLVKCQKQIMDACMIKYSFLNVRLKGDFSLFKEDDICSVCQDGGDLILCDYCPSAFHASCVGLEHVTEGKWSCPSCKCGICGLSEYNSNAEQFEDETMLYCDQCHKEHHVGCLRENRSQQLNCCPTGCWFCSKKCEQIFYSLQELIGKSNPTSVENIFWTVLRMSTEDNAAANNFDLDNMAEHHSKLRIALDILHDCFEPVVEPRTGSDIVADIIFNTKLELKRLRFSGFYTMLVEKEDEIISVATFRVHNEKVAEMPLVATRAKYRKQGMCHLLVNELEKLLSNLGVERLLLPAVPQLINTWTTSYGFVEMGSSDVAELSDCTLLNFQGTTMCQKFLKTKEAVEERKVVSRDLDGEVREEEKTKYNMLVSLCSQMFSTTTPLHHREAFQYYLAEGW